MNLKDKLSQMIAVARKATEAVDAVWLDDFTTAWGDRLISAASSHFNSEMGAEAGFEEGFKEAHRLSSETVKPFIALVESLILAVEALNQVKMYANENECDGCGLTTMSAFEVIEAEQALAEIEEKMK